MLGSYNELEIMWKVVLWPKLTFGWRNWP